MKWMRKWILAATTALVLAAPLTVAPSAQANTPQAQAGHQRAYYLVVRASPDSPWYTYGPSNDYNLVRAWVNYLKQIGYDAYMR